MNNMKKIIGIIGFGNFGKLIDLCRKQIAFAEESKEPPSSSNAISRDYVGRKYQEIIDAPENQDEEKLHAILKIFLEDFAKLKASLPS